MQPAALETRMMLDGTMDPSATYTTAMGGTSTNPSGTTSYPGSTTTGGTTSTPTSTFGNTPTGSASDSPLAIALQQYLAANPQATSAQNLAWMQAYADSQVPTGIDLSGLNQYLATLSIGTLNLSQPAAVPSPPPPAPAIPAGLPPGVPQPTDPARPLLTSTEFGRESLKHVYGRHIYQGGPPIGVGGETATFDYVSSITFKEWDVVDVEEKWVSPIEFQAKVDMYWAEKDQALQAARMAEDAEDRAAFLQDTLNTQLAVMAAGALPGGAAAVAFAAYAIVLVTQCQRQINAYHDFAKEASKLEAKSREHMLMLQYELKTGTGFTPFQRRFHEERNVVEWSIIEQNQFTVPTFNGAGQVPDNGYGLIVFVDSFYTDPTLLPDWLRLIYNNTRPAN